MPDPIVSLNDALAGRYRVRGVLGVGGMATVYRADDLRHERKVALKVLKPELAAVVGADRFLAEIKTTANLQHPHILPLFDSGEADGFLFYVMPYVEGESLRQRLDREHQLPVEDAVRIATNIAEALDYAHRQGVIHRDIKPANLLLNEQGEPLVADFGIALAFSGVREGRFTGTGLSVGTPDYMSPEQAAGDESVDHRSDVFSLGCVLYEMLSGDVPFGAATGAGSIPRAVLARQRPIREVRPTVPEHVEHAIEKGLEKLPADRFSSAGSFAAALRNPAFRDGPASRRWSGTGPQPFSAWLRDPRSLVAICFAALALVSASVQWLRAPEESGLEPSLLNLDLGGIPSDVQSDVIVSRDGSTFAVASTPGTPRGIYVRRLNEPEFRLLPGTEEGRYPAFSPDGQWIVYRDWRSDALMKVALAGGGPLTVLPNGVLAHPLFPFWGDDDNIVFRASEGIYRVAATGGVPEPLLEGAWWASYPQVLPGERALIMTDSRDQSTVVLDLLTDSVRVVIPEGMDAAYVGGRYLLYAHPDGGLFTVRFDTDRLEALGAPTPVLEDVWVSDRAHFSVADNGTLVYGTGGNTLLRTHRALVEVVPDEGQQSMGLGAGRFAQPRWSPDGQTLAFVDGEVGTRHLYLMESGSSSPRQLTFEGDSHTPVWSPDGTRIVFSSTREGTAEDDLFAVDVVRDAPPDLVTRLDGAQLPRDWIGDRIVFENGISPTSLWTVQTDGRDPTPYLEDPEADIDDPSISPDGRWAAYQSNEAAGAEAIFARSFPTARERTRISTSEGQFPRWSPDGSTLYYWLAEDAVVDTLMAATVRTEPRITVSARRPVVVGAFEPEHWDVHPDGRRFVIAQAVLAPEEARERFIVVPNWIAHLHRQLLARRPGS